MKVYWFILLLPSFIVAQQRSSSELMGQGLQKYPLETAAITYAVSGNASGEETFTFDRFGWRSVKKASLKFELYGIESERSQNEVSDGEIAYRINHKDSTIRKRLDIRWSSQASSMTPQQVSESVLFSLGGSYASDSTLLGRKCQVWTFENRSLLEMWTWNGIPLKRKSKLGDQLIIATATKIDLEPTINPGTFKLPDYKLQE